MAETKTNLRDRIKNQLPVAYGYAPSSGGTDAYAVTYTPAFTAYETGRDYTFKADVLNTGPATLNVNGLGAKTLKKNVTEDLVNGDIIAGAILTCRYDGTNMQVIGGLAIDANASTQFSQSYTYGETIAQWDNLYLDETTNKLKKITSSSLTWDRWVGVAFESGVDNDTGKKVIVGGTVDNGSFANTAPTFSQPTGGFNTMLKDDTGATTQDDAFAMQYPNNGADCSITGGSVWLKKVGTPAGSVYIHIALGNASKPFLYNPNGASATSDIYSLYTTSIAAASITTSSTEFSFTFPSAIRIPAGAYVYIVITTSATASAGVNNFIIDSSAVATTGFSETNAGNAYRQWAGVSTTLRSNLISTSLSQIGNAVRLYNGSSDGTVSTGTTSMGYWNRCVGRVISTTAWVIEKGTRHVANVLQHYTADGGAASFLTTGSYNNALGRRPTRVFSDLVNTYTTATGPINWYSRSRFSPGDTLTEARMNMTTGALSSNTGGEGSKVSVIPYEKGVYICPVGVRGEYITSPATTNQVNSLVTEIYEQT